MDKISKRRRSANMAAIRSKDTGPEVAVRKVVSGLGYRSRAHGSALPGKPDLIFRKARKVIFVHGCFWHQHSKVTCLDGRKPKSNLKYWLPKLESNISRDKRNRAKLRRLGWRSIVIWECQAKHPEWIVERIHTFLRS